MRSHRLGRRLSSSSSRSSSTWTAIDAVGTALGVGSLGRVGSRISLTGTARIRIGDLVPAEGRGGRNCRKRLLALAPLRGAGGPAQQPDSRDLLRSVPGVRPAPALAGGYGWP